MWLHFMVLAYALRFGLSAKDVTGFHDQANSLQKPLKVFQNDGLLQPTFESPEHLAIGDGLTLNYLNGSIIGANFAYNVNGVSLSFGDGVALAGDFFFNADIGPCAHSISTDWDEDPEGSIKIAAENVDHLRKDCRSYLRCVRDKIYEQRDEVSRAVIQGKDVAQVYKGLSSKYDFEYGNCTLDYAIIALCNPDHFGKDAERAYSSVHTLALRQALKAHSDQEYMSLKEAYFIDSFAQHYLTDSFSAGDQLNRAQHDEDCANGLWATNREGESWAVYGDKQLGQDRSAKNRLMVQAAGQASVDEVWDVFQRGQVPKFEDYKALQKIPLPESTLGDDNFVPIFEKSASDENVMLFRQNLESRSNGKARQTMNCKQDNDGWNKILGLVKASGSQKNMYVFTKGFSSEQQVVHLGPINTDSSALVTNMYGPVAAGSFGRPWTMSSQGNTTLNKTTKQRLWTDVRSLGEGVISLVGRQYVTGSITNALHVGIRTSQTALGQLKSEVIWNQDFDDGNSQLKAGETIYDHFVENSSERCMLKYFDGPKRTSKVELWTLASSLSSAPTRVGWQSDIPKFKIKDDNFSTAVGYSSGPLSSSPGAWYFWSWKANLQKNRTSIINEVGVRRAQAVLSDPQTGVLFRLYYGKQYPETEMIRIDILQPTRVADAIVFPSDPPAPFKFPIRWAGRNEADYLLWFIHDVDGDGLPDLVAYTASTSNLDLTIIVFPRQANGVLGAPVVSTIVVPPEIGTLFTSEFMDPLSASQATYTYPDGQRTDGAVLSFFDNYGVVGARIIAPEALQGSLRYELKGQDSAIAGQRSGTIGERKGDWMGLDRRTLKLGLVPM